MTFELGVVTNEFGKQLTELRTAAYRAQYGESVDVSALAWNPRLSHTLNLGIFVSNEKTPKRLVSAYRLDIVRTPSELHNILQTENLKPEDSVLFSMIESIRLPAVVSCRACTDKNFGGLDLHFALRWWAVQICRGLKVPNILSTFESSNPWATRLTKAGYELHANPNDWNEFLPNQSRPIIAFFNVEAMGNHAESSFADANAFKVPSELREQLLMKSHSEEIQKEIERWSNELRAKSTLRSD